MLERRHPLTDATRRAGTVTASLLITGMDCESCAEKIQRDLTRVAGVLLAVVVSKTDLAVVAYDPALTYPSKLLEVVRRAARDGRHAFDAVVLRVSSLAGHARTARSRRP